MHVVPCCEYVSATTITCHVTLGARSAKNAADIKVCTFDGEETNIPKMFREMSPQAFRKIIGQAPRAAGTLVCMPTRRSLSSIRHVVDQPVFCNSSFEMYLGPSRNFLLRRGSGGDNISVLHSKHSEVIGHHKKKKKKVDHVRRKNMKKSSH